jgi:phosphoglycolate phosphatase
VLVSNKGTRGLTQLVAQLDLGHRFDLVLAADTVSRRKPDPGLFAAHVAPAFPGVAPGRVLVVGDTDIDLRFAGNIGARACWARYGYGDAAACAALAPAYAIDAVDDLRRVLAV